MFILHGTVQDDSDSILVVGLDNRFEQVDTIFCHNGEFTWKYRPDTVTTLILILPDGRRHPVFAEKDVESFITIPTDTGVFNVSGGYCNDTYQSFYLASLNDSSIEQAVARIDSFITRDPFSEVAPYLIYDRMVRHYHAKESVIEPLIKRMSGNMQDAPYLVSLKGEFEKPVTNNTYLDNYSVMDSIGHKYQFVDIGGTSNNLLVCVWASWMGQAGLDARDTLKYFFDKYRARNFNVTDISIDANVERWKDAIRKDTVDWFSYNDPNGWESRIARGANLQTAPAFVLFTGVKRIIYKTTSIKDLDLELDKTLSKPKPLEDLNNKNKNNTKNKTKQIKIAQ
jgi:hypothetical protein